MQFNSVCMKRMFELSECELDIVEYAYCMHCTMQKRTTRFFFINMYIVFTSIYETLYNIYIHCTIYKYILHNKYIQPPAIPYRREALISFLLSPALVD